MWRILFWLIGLLCYFPISLLAAELEVTTNRLNLRAGPGTGYRVIGQVERGERFPIVERQRGWYQIKLGDGRMGWVSGSLVREIPSSSQAGASLQSTASSSPRQSSGSKTSGQATKGSSPVSDMVLIPAGTFLMGSEDGDQDENPPHRVSLQAFYLDKYEVTNAQYKAFLQSNGHPPPRYWNDNRFNQPDAPVVGVTWYDARDYCRWKGKRLPTEAEWERAARGPQGYLWPWGNEYKEGYANVEGTADGYKYTAPVGRFEQGKTAEGVYDMAGNVWEWIADWYNNTTYSSRSTPANPTGPENGTLKVLRGGSWIFAPELTRATNRNANPPDNAYVSIGFRCAKGL